MITIKSLYKNSWAYLTISYPQEEQQGEVSSYPPEIKEPWKEEGGE